MVKFRHQLPYPEKEPPVSTGFCSIIGRESIDLSTLFDPWSGHYIPHATPTQSLCVNYPYFMSGFRIQRRMLQWHVRDSAAVLKKGNYVVCPLLKLVTGLENIGKNVWRQGYLILVAIHPKLECSGFEAR